VNKHPIHHGVGFVCECKDGYVGDGQFCADLDECAISADGTRAADIPHQCDPLASCTNTDASYTCTCPDVSSFVNSSHRVLRLERQNFKLKHSQFRQRIFIFKQKLTTF
jgi:hypothetical protein